MNTLLVVWERVKVSGERTWEPWDKNELKLLAEKHPYNKPKPNLLDEKFMRFCIGLKRLPSSVRKKWSEMAGTYANVKKQAKAAE